MRLLQITLIPDKSALQGFSLEESVWMDALFVCGIPDVLHVEILADIEKNRGKGREVKNEVRRLVKKLPEMQGVRLFSYNEIARGETQRCFSPGTSQQRRK